MMIPFKIDIHDDDFTAVFHECMEVIRAQDHLYVRASPAVVTRFGIAG